MDVGRTVLLEAGDIRVIVTETCQAPNDPAYFRLHGIDPATIPLLCVKAKNHFRAAFAGMARCLVDVDCPGPASRRIVPLQVQPRAPEHLVESRSGEVR